MPCSGMMRKSAPDFWQDPLGLGRLTAAELGEKASGADRCIEHVSQVDRRDGLTHCWNSIEITIDGRKSTPHEVNYPQKPVNVGGLLTAFCCISRGLTARSLVPHHAWSGETARRSPAPDCLYDAVSGRHGGLATTSEEIGGLFLPVDDRVPCSPITRSTVGFATRTESARLQDQTTGSGTDSTLLRVCGGQGRRVLEALVAPFITVAGAAATCSVVPAFAKNGWMDLQSR